MVSARISFRFVVFLFISSLVFVAPASATPIGWKFSGVLGQEGGAVLSLPATSPFEWVVYLNPNAPNNCSSSEQGSYLGIAGGELTIGGHQWTGGAGSVEVNTIHGACPGPSPTGVSFRQFSWTPMSGASMFPLTLVGSLEYLVRTDGSMPDLPPPTALVTWSGLGPFNTFDVWTQVDETTTPVPEPATLTLLGTGLAVACWRRRRTTRESAPRRSA